MIAKWIEANWPTDADPNACRHCGQRDPDRLIPIGYGPRQPVWLHHECWEPWRAALRRKAAITLGLEHDDVADAVDATDATPSKSVQQSPAEEAAERAASVPRGYAKAELEAARRDAKRLGYGRRKGEAPEDNLPRRERAGAPAIAEEITPRRR